MSRTTVVNVNETDEWDVYIGRSDGRHMNNTDIGDDGWLGNPYRLEEGYSRTEAVNRFEEDFHERIDADVKFRAAVEDLKGETLACHCKPKACHGDVIVRYLEDSPLAEW
jgi:hypothetical protein